MEAFGNGELEDDAAAVARRWQLVQHERAALVRLARRRGLSAEDAEDCAHEAMLRVVRFVDLDETRVGALLSTVVTRLAIDMQRRATRTSVVHARLAMTSRLVASGDPETVACDRAEAHWSARLVGRLPAQQQRALRGRAEGVAVKDLAREMTMTAKAVESLISRARAAMRATMTAGMGSAVGLVRRWRTVTAGVVPALATAAVIVGLPLIAPVDRSHAPTVDLGRLGPDQAGGMLAASASHPLPGAAAPKGQGGHRDEDHAPAATTSKRSRPTPPTTIVEAAGVAVTHRDTEDSQVDAARKCIENDGLVVEAGVGDSGITYYVRCEPDPDHSGGH